jgi:hypothetical protein
VNEKRNWQVENCVQDKKHANNIAAKAEASPSLIAFRSAINSCIIFSSFLINQRKGLIHPKTSRIFTNNLSALCFSVTCVNSCCRICFPAEVSRSNVIVPKDVFKKRKGSAFYCCINKVNAIPALLRIS